MGHFRDNIDNMIMTARKTGNRIEADTYKLFKAKMLEFTTAKNAGVLNDAAEITIIQKMVKELAEDISTYTAAGRHSLVEEASAQHDILTKLLPPIADAATVEAWVVTTYGDVIEKSKMGIVIKAIKAIYIGFDGKLASEIVKRHLA